MNYVFPELANYKYEWIHLLKAARGHISAVAGGFVCNALYAAAQAWNASEKLNAQANELIDYIEQALEDQGSVIGWFRANRPNDECDSESYRRAWIDHIIKECQKCQNP